MEHKKTRSEWLTDTLKNVIGISTIIDTYQEGISAEWVCVNGIKVGDPYIIPEHINDRIVKKLVEDIEKNLKWNKPQ